MGNLTNISAKLKQITAAVTKVGDSASAFQDVREWPSTHFDGFPAVTITPAPIEGTYSTQAQNTRAYAFDIHIFYSLTNKNYDVAFQQMRELVDLEMDAIDQTIDLNGTVDFVKPTSGEFFEGDTDDGACLIAPIRVICQKDVPVQYGSF